MEIYGIFVGKEDLETIYNDNRQSLSKYSREELETKGIIKLLFMGIVPEYVVTRESPFYEYLRAEGRRDVTVIS